MNREEALEHFHNNYVQIIRKEKFIKLREYFEKNKEALALEFMKCFKTMCIKVKSMQQEGKKGEIGYINFSLYRTKILQKEYEYVVEAYNKYWFYDSNECKVCYNAIWAMKFLDELVKELSEKMRCYITKVIYPDIERIMLRELPGYNEVIVELIRYAMPEAVKMPEFLEIRREEQFSVRVGEYKGKYEVAFGIDDRQKDDEDIKDWLEKKLDYGYENEVLTNLDLSYADFDEIDMQYVDFSKSNLSGTSMKKCILKGARFEGANLSNVDFEGADLSSAVFKGALLKNVCFKGADLKGAVFSCKDNLIELLDEQQRSKIIVL